MNLQERILLLIKLGNYLKSNDDNWLDTQVLAEQKNGWFTREFLEKAAGSIADNYLKEDKLRQWAGYYKLDDNIQEKCVGIVMAGNIPMVGFHDFLCVFIAGHKQMIKMSSKDDVLLKHLVKVMAGWNSKVNGKVIFAEMLKNCDAYIATGSNNSSRYFEQYFGKYPNIIRSNRTSVAVLNGSESTEELEKLADDMHLYFGLGCRNVTKIYVPENYDFIPIIKAFDKYQYFSDHHKYKNNYDYQLSILLLNGKYYMTNGSTLLTQNESFFSPISQVHYQFYTSPEGMQQSLQSNRELQCIVGHSNVPFGQAQNPGLFQYADSVDTMAFLLGM
ncbi:MAG: acyl-CoA reductase [Chitinophagaceae bacterium]|nr:acyl-CoA reductase [Chitinophagaceae bacterium]MBK8774334.1 acyl-CoA reductase [Chitinophagaceae bacterium]